MVYNETSGSWHTATLLLLNNIVIVVVTIIIPIQVGNHICHHDCEDYHEYSIVFCTIMICRSNHHHPNRILFTFQKGNNKYGYLLFDVVASHAVRMLDIRTCRDVPFGSNKIQKHNQGSRLNKHRRVRGWRKYLHPLCSALGDPYSLQ